MKKIIITSMTLASLSIGIFLYSCTKDKSIQPQNPPHEVSVFKNENGKFKKEIVVTDESGKNSLFLAVYSDYQSAIDEYLKTTELKLIIEKDDFIEKYKQNISRNRASSGNDTQPSDIKKDHFVNVDFVTSNFEDNVKAYSIEVKTKESTEVKTKESTTSSFSPGAYTFYGPSTSHFCGVVHQGYGYDINVYLNYRNASFGIYQNCWHGILNPSGSMYSFFCNSRLSNRTQVGVYLDSRQGSVNYKVCFSRSEFRGHNCTIGTYWGGEDCYYGTPPSGTTAFIWQGGGVNNFYFTPLNGNQCPSPGSFDGANCWVLAVPGNCEPFIRVNSWFVKTDLM